MSAGASLEGAAAFLKAFAGSKGFLEGAALQTQRVRAQRIVDRAKAHAPVGDPSEDPHAGRLVADIGIKGQGITPTGPYIEVGTTVPEGFLQEFGTVDERPQPFMRPAIAEEGAV